MSLDEKAKTLQEWMDEVTYVRLGKLLVPEKPEQVARKLVLLSDHKQEIEEAVQRAFKDDELINNWLEEQQQELKQKIRKEILEDKHAFISKSKLEELLE